MHRRTALVVAAWPDVDALAHARDVLLAEEKPHVLFAGVKVCPFAGYVDVDDKRVGCLLHPTRRPDGADLRDLAVYPKEVCAGHYCAPHDWLRPREVALAQTCTGTRYGRVVTDAGLVKAVASVLDNALGRAFTADDVAGAAAALDALWSTFLVAWPWADADPARFGGFHFSGDDAVERTLPSSLAGTHAATTTSPAMRMILDALGTRALDDDEAGAAIAFVEREVSKVAQAIE